MKKIEDYLHLYVGSEFITHNSQGEVNLATLSTIYVCLKDGHYKSFHLLLRPLSEMTVSEIQLFFSEFHPDHELDYAEWTTELNGIPCSPHWTLWRKESELSCRVGYEISMSMIFNISQVLWLLKKGFDLFGLIEAGLAVDKNSVNN